MTDADKLLVRRLFLQIAELPAAARAAALERACQGNARLRTEVEALLRADAEAGQFMASPTADGVARKAPEGSLSSEQPGSSIGRYKLLEQIGEGGMGTIWMAEQREPVKRRVALKIIKLGMDTKQVIARFEAERQALAMMDHPNIAKVFDAGSTDAGRPYFVMEYIKGIPVLEYCDQQKVDTKSRLELFLAVCHAIQHAHQKGVIHRDIKPSNVLVTLHDGVPVCKVIDFGIAKATNSELTTKTLFTEHRQMVGTPAYMSPEQAEMSGLDIDTRSDIYSLGVLLYELLTGTTPFDIEDLLAKGLGEMMRTIREVEPHKPSTRISELGEIGTRTAMERRVDQDKLCSLLRGDLDWIVMKCLEKDRSRRYETANGLAADIRRHLDDEPVTAGAPSASYRLHKFIRRNKVQVLAGGAVAAALLIGVVGFAWQAKLANEQRIAAENARESESVQRKLADASRNEAETQARIAQEREAEARKSAAEAIAQEAEARKQAAIAEAIARFQTEMLAAADPQNLLGDTVTVVQVMAAAVTLLDAGSLAEQPLAEARVRATIGMTLEGLGRYDDAEPNLRKALAITRAVHPAGHEDITTCVHMLAGVLLAQNNHVEAERLSRETLETARAVYPAGHPELASALNLRAMQLLALDKNAEAEPLLREALAIERQVAPDGRQGTDSYLDNLAKVLWNLNQLDEAEALFREALAIRREALPAAHPTIAMGLNNLAALLHHRSKFDEAEPLQREALGIYRASLPAGHPDIAKCLQVLAGLLQSQGRYAEADSLAREALDIDRAAGHPGIVQSLTRLGTLRMTQGKFAEAEPLLHEALAASRAFLPAGHRDIATALGNLAMVLDRQDKHEEAEPVLRESIALLRASVPADHPHLVATLRFLAHFYERRGKVDQAVPVRRELLGSTRASLQKDSPELAVHLMAFGESLITLEQWGEAEGVLRECLTIREKAEPDAWTTWNTRSSLGAAMLGQKKFAEAEELLLAGYRGLKEREASIPPGGAIRIPRAIEHLVQLYEAMGNATEAAAWRGRLEAARAAVPAPRATGGRR